MSTIIKTLNLGIDLGNAQIKTKNNVFLSRVEYGYDPISEDKKIKVKYENDIYSVGIGTEITNKQKYFSPFYKILLLTAIAENFPNDDLICCNIVIGLPVQYFKDFEFRNKVKDEILKIKNETIIVENKIKNINISNVEIFVEGGIISLYEEYQKDKIIVVDIGGYSIDNIEFLNSKLGKSKTYINGIIKLKTKILQSINEDSNSSLTNADEVFDYILNKKPFFINKKIVSLEKYENMIFLYIQKLINDLNIDFTLEDKKIIFIGGGSIVLKKYIEVFKNDYEIKVIEDININAKVFQDLSENIF